MYDKIFRSLETKLVDWKLLEVIFIGIGVVNDRKGVRQHDRTGIKVVI